MKRRIIGIAFVTLLMAVMAGQTVYAGGVVGSGTPESCTQTAFKTIATTGGTVTFNCGGAHTIVLTSPLNVTKTTIIDGGGLITLSGGGTTNVIYNDAPLLTLRNLTIRDGFWRMPASITGRDIVDGGAGVRGEYRASLTVENSTFLNNRIESLATDIGKAVDNGGGAIFNHTGTLIIRNSVFRGNHAQNSGGGAVHVLHSNVEVTDTVFENNSSTIHGGGYYGDGIIPGTAGWMRFTRVSFLNNTANGQGGGAFVYMYYNREPQSSATFDQVRFIGNRVTTDVRGFSYGGGLRAGNGIIYVNNTTFQGNQANKAGGAIWTGEIGRIYLTNVTISGNRAVDANALGGGIRIASSGPFVMTNVTIANNHAGYRGGALSGGGNNVTLRNTIIGRNTAGNPFGENILCGQYYINGGGNIQATNNYTRGSNPQCAVGIPIVDPELEPLADYGGFGEIHGLLPDSPAVDAGVNLNCADTDQRGKLRPLDGNHDGEAICDSGAYESDGSGPTSGPGFSPFRNVYASTNVGLTWNRLTWATGYEIEVDNQVNFSSVNARKSVSGGATLATSIEVPSPGMAYYWRVRGRLPDGTWGIWSPPEQFYVEPADE